MAQLVQVDRGLDFEVIVDEFRTQLPLNTGRLEWDLLTGAPENHPVIAFERAVLSLPMTLPAEFTASIEQEADRVYAEFERSAKSATVSRWQNSWGLSPLGTRWT